MHRKASVKIFALVAVLFSVLPSIAHAQYGSQSNFIYQYHNAVQAQQQAKPQATPQPVQVTGPTFPKTATYVPLIQGFPTIAAGETRDFAGFFNTLVKIVIGLTGVLAVLVIVLGGIQYVSTDSWTGKDSGKKRIQAAVGGLILALSSYLILNTIDPSLTYLNFTQSLKPVNIPTATGIGVTQPNLPSAGGVGGTVVVAPDGTVTVVPTGNVPRGSELVANPDGSYSITPSAALSIDTDGRTRPPFDDPSYQPETSYRVNGQYLDATKDIYVVVPDNSPIALGTKVTITDHTSGKQVVGIVGDHGGTKPYGELSLAAAKAIGAWTDGMGNTAHNHNVTYTFHTNSGEFIDSGD